MGVQVGVNVAAAGTHDQALKGRQPHAGVHAASVQHGAAGAAVAKMGSQPGTVALAETGQQTGLIADVFVAGAVKAVTAYAVHGVQLVGQRVAEGVRRHGLVKCRIEHRNLWRLRQQLHGGADTGQVGRIMQWCQRDVGFDAGDDVVVEQLRAGKALSAMDHPVADRTERSIKMALNHW